jgi:Domain of unknown function (DUF932).
MSVSDTKYPEYRLTNDELFKMAGIRTDVERYQPANIGKKAVERPSPRTFINTLNRVNYKSPEMLKNMVPEIVTKNNVMYVDHNGEIQVSARYKAIIGEETGTLYSMMTDRYKIIQHSDIVNALANTAEEVNVNTFGTINEQRGVMNIHSTFANPEYHINMRESFDDPVMLGVRVYNSHNGQTGFGGEIFGIRYVCSNYMTMGESLGTIHWKHFEEREKIITGLSKLIRGYMQKVPALQKKTENADDEILTIDEATAMLWGISLQPSSIEGITENITKLNPEITQPNKVTVYQLYNAGTAYVSHRTASDNTTETNLDNSRRMQKILNESPGRLIDIGNAKREKYKKKEEEDLKMWKQNIQIMGD